MSACVCVEVEKTVDLVSGALCLAASCVFVCVGGSVRLTKCSLRQNLRMEWFWSCVFAEVVVGGAAGWITGKVVVAAA